MSDHVFVCYARKDEQFVLQLAENLKRTGVPTWLDQWNIPPGADWDRSIDDAIYDCGKFLIVLSPNSVDSSEVRAELRTALDERKPIIPVIQSSCRMPRQLRTIQYVDFSSCGPDDEVAVKRLLQTLAGATESGVSQKVRPATPFDQTHDGAATQLEIKVREGASLSDKATTTNVLIKPGTVFRDTLKDGSQGPEMVVIPDGEFRMGDIQRKWFDWEKPVHAVRIPKSFAIGKYPITFEEYDKFAGATGRELPKDERWGRDRRPVINVSWEDAVDYANWLSAQTGKTYRLPSEAEWEYAARSGGKEETWAGTSDENKLADYAVFQKSRTEPVGSKEPNGIGLHDMSGNVWEWVEDCWHENYEGAPTDGRGWKEENRGQCGQRVIRGGSWDNRPGFLRSSLRYRTNADDRDFGIGFRLAQDLP